MQIHFLPWEPFSLDTPLYEGDDEGMKMHLCKRCIHVMALAGKQHLSHAKILCRVVNNNYLLLSPLREDWIELSKLSKKNQSNSSCWSSKQETTKITVCIPGALLNRPLTMWSKIDSEYLRPAMEGSSDKKGEGKEIASFQEVKHCLRASAREKEQGNQNGKRNGLHFRLRKGGKLLTFPIKLSLE